MGNAQPGILQPGAAERLAAVQRAAEAFVAGTRRSSETREEEVGRVAALLATSDAAAAERLRASAQAATREAVQRAEEQAGEVARTAANRVLMMAARYGATLASEKRRENDNRVERQRELITGVARVDAPAAKAIEEAIEEADSARIANAIRQGDVIVAAAGAAIQSPTPARTSNA